MTSLTKRMIPYGTQDIEDDDVQAVVEILRSDRLTQGPRIEAFEEAIAQYCGARYAVVCSSGTAALHLSYLALGIGPGQSIVTTPMSFAATSNAAFYVGASPIFSDIDPETHNLSPQAIRKTLAHLEGEGALVRAIVPVHYAGRPCEMKKIKEIAAEHHLPIIEDACHAMGSEVAGRMVGAESDITIFSFHPVKAITTGEGGAAVTNDKDLYERLKQYRNHGMTRASFMNESDGDWYYEMQVLGFNYRMTELQAGLGLSQLRKIDRFVKRRREIASRYSSSFNDNPYFDLPTELPEEFSSYHLYPITLKDKYKSDKKMIFQKLTDQGLGVQTHYIPIYWHPYYQEKGYKRGLCPRAEDFYQREISLPIYPAMTDEDSSYVIQVVWDSLREL